ncbi:MULTISPECIES: Fic family protein [unclassified Bradyrhizobium]|uniref:Fic family protein n=1 Tax=unclassified Bradyrhizobium TaxID=2631580 RepID=UPI001CD6C246|nr:MULTISPECIES: Fic family protein [unclassified Bradyrhizobium]
MKAFIDWFNGAQEIDAVLKAAIAHLWFATIHPFEDGNGRNAPRDCRYGAGPLREQLAALLQHVGPDPAGA